jgi:bacterioferritin (cytochrome b1)
MARTELIENLNGALSLELAGVIQYSQHSYLVTASSAKFTKVFSAIRRKKRKTTPNF